MKLRFTLTIIFIGLAGSIPSPLSAQETFDSGSDGSDGALTVTQLTILQLPPDGIFNFTTINIEQNGRLFFTPNAANTPVFLLAMGDVTIEGNIFLEGTKANFSAGGAGGPGGFAGGSGGDNPGDGLGPGGGPAGWRQGQAPAGESEAEGASYGSKPASGNGSTYGNTLLIPLVGGSGGGGSQGTTAADHRGGHGGGGAILIASNTRITCGYVRNEPGGRIVAKGAGDGSEAGGSGGAIRLVSPTVAGGLYADVRPDSVLFPGGQGRWAGYGRIRIDSLNPGGLQLATETGDLSSSFATVGSNMVVFPPNLPSIRITNAAGQSIPDGQTAPVFVLLPPGSPQTQSITVRVSEFGTTVPLTAVVTPEAGTKTSVDFEINNSTGGNSETNVNVQIPVGVSSRVDVWTR